MQTKTNNLERIAEKTGLRVSKEKTKVMRANTKQQDKIKFKGEDLEDVKSVTYLGVAFKNFRGFIIRAG